jgi:uncharacterized membrane protein YphA (DoxX/SURF4 family)
MKARTIGYWITTALVGFAFVGGGVADLMHAPSVMDALSHLGYPSYVATLLGIWKLLGAITILMPAAPRLKEWAYAGIAFDLSGAVVSHVSAGDSVAQFAAPIALLALAIASWALRPGSRRLASLAHAPARVSPSLGHAHPEAA